MKTRAVSLVLLMIASALAGCTSGDPDGDGELGIDTDVLNQLIEDCLLYTSPSPRDVEESRMPSSA